MANLNLKFLRGLQNSLPATGTDGYFYLTTDTHRLFTSIDGKVVPVNEGVTIVANLEALTSITGANAGDFFYCTQENILCVYNGQTFVQINPDTGMTSVEVVGNGNAVTAASYDAATRKLTLTMGETFATKTYVGEIPADATATDVVGYIQEKTAHIATDAALEELTDRVTTAEGEIDALQEDSHTHTFADSDVEDAIAKKHAHTFTDADVVDAISKKHSHTFNETELNKIVEGDVAKWNGVAADHLTSADKTTLENAIKDAKKAGTDANTNIETYKVSNDARVKAVEDDIAEITDGTNGILATAKAYSDGKLATARTEISAEIDADVKTVADDLAGYKTSNDTALAGVKATAEAAATKAYTDEELAKKVDKVTGKSLVSDTEITKLAGVSEGANKVEASENNGKIKIDGQEVTVYTHPEKHAIADVDGLGDALAGMQVKGDYAAEEHKHVKADITDFAHTHVASEITDLDATIKGYDYATKTEAQGYADAKDEAIAAAKKAGDDAQKAADDAQKTADDITAYVGTFTASEGVDTVVKYIDAKTANIASDERVDGIDERLIQAEKDIDALETESAKYAIKTEVEAALALKADKSVVDAMYTNDQIDGFIAEAKKYSDDNDANTTYTIGYESKVDGEDGHPARIVLTPSEGEAQYIDATPFIKDGMLDNVAYNEATNTLTFTFNTDAGKEAVTVELTDILAPYTGSTGDRVKVEVTDGVISADLVADSISKDYLDDAVKASLALADSALQSHQDISHLATKEELNAAKTEAANQDAVVLAEAQAYADQAQTDAEAKAAELDAALKAELQGEIDTDVKVVSDALAQYKIDNDAAVALKANTADVYAKTDTYTKAEVDAAIEAAVTSAHEWGSF